MTQSKSNSPEVKLDEQGKSQVPTPAHNKVPGRTLGFCLMSILIISVGFWMQRESERMMNTAGTESENTIGELEGFNGSFLYLPMDDLAGFVEIPAGEFIMGSNPVLDAMAYENERWSSSLRQGAVELPAYFISRFEVTVAQFKKFVEVTGTRTTANLVDLNGRLPVTNITWPEALAYTRWLEQQLLASNQTPAVLLQALQNGAHVTLPNEAEWEKAARGTDGRIFPWGSERTAAYANFDSDALTPVGSTPCPACSYGLSDMSGNAWEFTRSALQDYPFDTNANPADLDKDPIWVMRGGSYSDAINNVRAAVRGGVDPGVRSAGIGFRVVISTL